MYMNNTLTFYGYQLDWHIPQLYYIKYLSNLNEVNVGTCFLNIYKYYCTTVQLR